MGYPSCLGCSASTQDVSCAGRAAAFIDGEADVSDAERWSSDEDVEGADQDLSGLIDDATQQPGSVQPRRCAASRYRTAKTSACGKYNPVLLAVFACLCCTSWLTQAMSESWQGCRAVTLPPTCRQSDMLAVYRTSLLVKTPTPLKQHLGRWLPREGTSGQGYAGPSPNTPVPAGLALQSQYDMSDSFIASGACKTHVSSGNLQMQVPEACYQALYIPSDPCWSSKLPSHKFP